MTAPLGHGRWWVIGAALLAGALAGVAVLLVAHATGTDLPATVAVPAGLVAGALLALALRLPTTDPAPPEPAPAPRAGSADAGLGDLGSLVFTLDAASRDADRFEVRVRPRLTALAVDRLWHAHGLDWHTPAGRAAAEPLLGPHTRALLTAPPGTLRLTPAALQDWTEELESL
ncbi:hypothetical protein [uncultured Modestobacter sp.]|uniref:hypothetical protein n=1 Tax=uncultured Modestobacter sp. TaxID=380048 RepID=UPI002610DFC0|nr:hypothetical protein [uncultured Modestobacter sp.]